ncbi:MAG: response regulator [Candidatus Dadabacteria bacterium]|nr:response regulator [Candidatus Dadabacteria bacterium]NIS08376.1 response regulator [Candidatus Dadabacteria bacterium]NIV41518.1 response regulator [Candidatus Dadabacteria bacterium]NIX15260.1 response regulator [Candidatus Dadabacteria bacterium]NIY21886.1 response regulator [Candidatus Dadabacteria bacterium]
MSKKILLVCDDNEKSEVLSSALANSGYDTTSLSDSSDLVNKSVEVNPDMIIMDINIPIKDGYKICRDLKETPDTQHIKVIFVKNDNNPLEKAWSVVKGADFYFATKNPFSENNLIQSMSVLN